MRYATYLSLGCALSCAAALEAQGIDLTVAAGATLTVSQRTNIDIVNVGGLRTRAGSTLELQGIIELEQGSARIDGALAMAIDGQLPGAGVGRLVVGDELDIENATGITVAFINGYAPGATDIFALASYSSLVGTFDPTVLPPPDWDLDYDGGFVRLLRLSALPLSWLGVDATATEAGVSVDWSTAEERHTDHFAVERSRDGDAWTVIGQVAAVGTGAGPFEYDFLDVDPGGAGTVYYRIEQFDVDGASEYSDAVSVQLHDATGTLYAFPSPVAAGAELQVRGVDAAAEPQTFRLVDASGRVLLRGQAQDLSAGTLALPVLPKGYYTLEVQYRSGTSKQVGFLVQ